jgi:hypothetical protein
MLCNADADDDDDDDRRLSSWVLFAIFSIGCCCFLFSTKIKIFDFVTSFCTTKSTLTDAGRPPSHLFSKLRFRASVMVDHICKVMLKSMYKNFLSIQLFYINVGGTTGGTCSTLVAVTFFIENTFEFVKLFNNTKLTLTDAGRSPSHLFTKLRFRASVMVDHICKVLLELLLLKSFHTQLFSINVATTFKLSTPSRRLIFFFKGHYSLLCYDDLSVG